MLSQRPVYYDSNDGLQLFAKEYINNSAKTKILCLHGITRNSLDFDDLCKGLQDDYHLLAADQRGRGSSSYDPNPDNYSPGSYVLDMFALLDDQAIDNIVLIGTSMGGIMAMMMAAMQPKRIKAVILNDVGPVIDQTGLQRIKGYIGENTPIENWQDAANCSRKLNAIAFPDYKEEDWQRFARRLYKEDENGIPYLAYDPAIAQPVSRSKEAVSPIDLWPFFDVLLNKPLLLIRGALSDILSPDCVAEMQHRKPDMKYVEIADRGHAPMLDELEALQAINQFLSNLADR